MTDSLARPLGRETGERRLRRRHRAERRFRLYGVAALALALACLALLIASIVARGYTAFLQTEIRLELFVDPDHLEAGGERSPAALARADYQGLIKAALRDLFDDVTERRERRELYGLVSSGAEFELRDRVLARPGLVGTRVAVWLPASDDVDMLMKGRGRPDLAEAERRLSDRQLAWLRQIDERGLLRQAFNWRFLANSDSREPEIAGILGAFVGSLYAVLVCLALSFPIGVMSAVFLEEFAPANRWTELVEININNLAAVPSIVFGLLGLAIFLNLFGLPRSAPLVGGMVLALMTLPTIIIAARAALRAVPPSLREAALALGASPIQVALHHTLPAAMPGVLTGTIISMARALGETAPLLMIGMVAFVVDIPRTPVDPAATLPVQIFLWADSPERAFAERAAAAIIVLLAFLMVLNFTAIVLRRRFEIRW